MAERIPTFTLPARPYDEALFDGYQAAPLRIVGRGKRRTLLQRQDLIAEHFAAVAKYELQDVARPKSIDFVIHSIISRMHQREGLNGINYQHRLHEKPNLEIAPAHLSKTAILEACRRARNGGATPHQNDINRRVSGMAAAEIANLTMIGAQRRDLEASMWDDVSSLVGQDASPNPDDMYRLRIMGFDRDIRDAQHASAMRISMKRFIGHTDDGATMKARTTAIINVSPSSGFDQDIITQFRDVAATTLETHEPERRRDEEAAYQCMSELVDFRNAVRWLIEGELPRGLVLARNETVYEEHVPTRDAVMERRRENEAFRSKRFGLAA